MKYVAVAFLLAISITLGCGSHPAGHALTPENQDHSNGALANTIPSIPDAAMQLPKPRSTSYAEDDLIKTGDDIDLTMPYNRVTPISGGRLVFDPEFGGPGGTSESVAFCLYTFSIPGYDRNDQVRYQFSTPPAEGCGWIGLANWYSNTWDWFPCIDVGIRHLPSIDPYIAFGGGLLMCIVATGTEDPVLDWVRIGAQPPEPAISPSAWRGWAPASINFNAGASDDPDGSITRYEWDLDGDGVFETDTGTGTEVSHDYPTPGTYNAVLRVTDNDGLTATVVTEVGVAAEYQHTWGRGGSECLSKMAIDGAGNLYQVGSTTGAGDGTSALLAKFDAVGQPVWARAFDSPGDDTLTGLAVSGGLIYTCGYTEIGLSGRDGLYQCWSSDGELVWSKAWGGTSEDRFNDMLISGGNLYLVGQTGSFNTNLDAIVVSCDTDGEELWGKRIAGNREDSANAIKRHQPFNGDPVLHVVGSYEDSTTDTDLAYFTLDEDGTLALYERFGDDGVQEGFGIVTPSFFSNQTIITGRTSNGISQDDLLIVSVTGDWARTWTIGSGSEVGRDIIRLPNGEYMVSGIALGTNQVFMDAVLITLSGAGEGLSVEMRDVSVSSDGAWDLCSYPGGVIVGGQAYAKSDDWGQVFSTLAGFSATWTVLPSGDFWVEGVVQAANGTVTPVESAVLDSGGGGFDIMYELRKLD